MHWLLFLALSAIAAMLYNPVYGWIQSAATTQANKSTGLATFAASYAGRTAVTTAAFFVVLLGAAFLLNLVGKKVSIPEVA